MTTLSLGAWYFYRMTVRYSCPVPRRAACGGYTLVEVLVSIFVLGSALAVFTTASLMSTATRGTEYRDIALHIAETELETLRSVGYSTLPTSGPFVSDELAELPGGAGTVTVTAYNAETKQVGVSVGWIEEGAERSVTLDTLITEVGGL